MSTYISDECSTLQPSPLNVCTFCSFPVFAGQSNAPSFGWPSKAAHDTALRPRGTDANPTHAKLPDGRQEETPGDAVRAPVGTGRCRGRRSRRKQCGHRDPGTGPNGIGAENVCVRCIIYDRGLTGKVNLCAHTHVCGFFGNVIKLLGWSDLITLLKY